MNKLNVQRSPGDYEVAIASYGKDRAQRVGDLAVARSGYVIIKRVGDIVGVRVLASKRASYKNKSLRKNIKAARRLMEAVWPQ